MHTALRRTFASLRVYNYRLYFIGQGLSLCGNWMQIVGVSWLVLQLTHSGTQLGLVTAAQFVPTLVLGVWGGVMADRFPKRRILLFTQTGIGLLSLLLGVLVVTHAIQIWMVYVIVACIGTIMVVDTPTRQTFVVDLVGKSAIRNAVTLNTMLVNVARIVGPSIAALLIATAGIGVCFIVNAATFLAFLCGILLMRKRELHTAKPVPSEPGQIRAGIRYVRQTPALMSTLLMMFIIGTFAYEFPVILPLFATITLHGTATTYSLMTTAMGIGAIAGGLYSAGRGEPTMQSVIRVAQLFGVSLLLLAIAPEEVTVLIVMLAVGALSVLFVALGNTTLQLVSADNMRGRVMSLWSIAFFGTTPIGGPIIGAIADHSNPRVGVAVGGVSTILASILGVRAAHAK